MRKLLLITLCLLLCCLPALSLAEDAPDGALILAGKVEAKDTVTVYAPFGGTVNDFSLKVGDRVSRDTTLVTLNPAKIYAPCDGIVRGVFVAAGDSAAYVQNLYGALCYIEPTRELTVQATTNGRYDSEDNRVLYNGERVYLKHTSNSRDANEGVGRIANLSGDSYTVEILSGDLELRDSVNIFRKSNYEYESRIGMGMVSRVPAVAVSGEGTILSVVAWDGGGVKTGDVLFEVVSGTLEDAENASTSIRAPQDGIIASVAVSAGQAVAKDQPVMALYQLDKLQLVASVSEMDLSRVKTGETVQLRFDSIADKTYEGTVKSISELGTLSDDYTEYAVYVEFAPDSQVRIGMSATATLR